MQIKACRLLLRGFVMEKFTLQNVPAASLNRKMRDMFVDLIDITMDDKGRGCLKSVPANFGYVFFWYGWLNQKTLTKLYPLYIPKEKVKEIKRAKKQNSALKLRDQVSDFLFSIVRDHPEVVGEGHAEVHLALLAPKLRHATVTDAAKALKNYAVRLEKLEAFTRKNLRRKTSKAVEEIEARFETVDFIKEKELAKCADEYFWDDECGYVELAHHRLGCEVQVRVHFKGDESLGDVAERIDKVVSPIKPVLDPMFRFGKSRWPF
ncbi:MAG: hypothetical protein NWF05_12010 [Candidatus Bathyarchaeota archaeon]|nr:hypothetical protein [Candidatus Bathyarchaeota archaeon]